MIEKAVTSFENGLVIVDDSLNQPTNSYPFAMNAMKDSVGSTPHLIANEKGFDKYLNLLNDGDIILGAQALNDKSLILFVYSPTTTPASKIYQTSDSIDSEFNGTINLLVEDSALNFNPLYPIKSTYKLNSKNERIVYFIQENSFPNSINIDDPNNYSANTGSFYPEYSAPIIEGVVNDLNGSLVTGAYQFFISYKYDELSLPYTGLTSSYYILKPSQSSTSKPDQEKAGSESNLPTTKSITLNLTELDLNFNKLDIGVLITIDGVSSAYIVKSNIPYSTSSLEYLYTGSESKVAISDINEVLVDPTVISSANVIAQKNNRLLLGDITYLNTVLDYQEYANNIRVTWYDTEEVEGSTETMSLRTGNSLTDKYDTPDKNVAKQFKTSFSAAVPLSLMRDEVYALGIQFELKNGGYTPVYHIPGRAIDKRYDGNDFVGVETNPEILDNFSTWDSELVTIPEYAEEARWKSFNTASAEGDLAYYESEEVYPDGYGFPTTGSSVNGIGVTKVRHHKMPDGRLSPIYRTDVTSDGSNNVYTNYRKYLGLSFSNIELPEAIAEEVTGLRFMIAPRDTPSNKSIIAKGLFQNISTSTSEGTLYGQTPRKFNNYDMGDDDSDLSGDNSGSPARQNRLKAFHSPDTSFESPILSTSKVSVEFMQSGVPYYIYANPSDNGVLEYAAMCLLNRAGEVTRDNGIIQSNTEDAIYVPYSTNLSDLGNINLISRFYNTDRQGLVLLQTAVDIYNLEDQSDENSVDNTNDSNLTSFLYGSLKSENVNQYGSILNLTYVPTDIYIKDLSVDGDNKLTATTEGLIGDCYIELFTKKLTISKYKDYMTNAPEIYSSVLGFFVETPLNIRYRITSSDLANSPFPQGVYLLNNEPYSYLEEVYYLAEQFTLNTDYNIGFTNKVYEGISIRQEDIGQNLNYSTRIIYSDVDSPESITDNYRIFRSNNYKDLPRNKGKLTSLFTKDESLYGTTLHSLWLISPTNQQLDTSGNNLVIGTGEFLSLEPKELLSVDSGYLGIKTPLELTHSPYGSLLIDSERGSMFLFDGKVENISLKSIQNWFFQNKELSLTKYGLTSINPHNPNGVGYLTAFDVENNRFLITKRDYDLVSPEKFKGSTADIESLVESENLEVGDILINLTDQRFYEVATMSPVILSSPLELTNTLVFYPKGFTLSYNVFTKNFVSFHSYIPTNYFSLHTRLYSRDVTQPLEADQAIFRHNAGIYGRYYTEDINPFILETTLLGVSPNTKVFDSFMLETYALSNDATYNSKTIYDLCFDTAILYNDTQCSGEIDLAGGDIKRVERIWRFNNFKDLSVNSSEPIWFTDPKLLTDNYYIDKILNTNRIDEVKPWYEKARMRDKYINARFILNNLDNKKFLCTFVSSNYRTSYR